MSDASDFSDSESLPYSCSMCDLVTEGLAQFERHLNNCHFGDKEKKPIIVPEEKVDNAIDGKVVVSNSFVDKEASDTESVVDEDNVSDWEEENIKSNYYDDEDSHDSDGMEEIECEGKDVKMEPVGQVDKSVKDCLKKKKRKVGNDVTKKQNDSHDSDGMEEIECEGKDVKMKPAAQVDKNDGDVSQKLNVKRRYVKQV